MIKAKHSRIARMIFNPYLSVLLKRNFGHFYVLNDPPFEQMKGKRLIVTPNHFSWWDGFFIDYMNRKLLKRNFYILMLEEQLIKYWFFRYLGAFSIRPGNAKSTILTARYSASVISDAENMVVFYPQGKIEDYAKHPLELKPGIKLFLNNAGADTHVLIVSFSIRYNENRKPDIAARFGKFFNAGDLRKDFEKYYQAFNESLFCLESESLRGSYKYNLFKKQDKEV